MLSVKNAKNHTGSDTFLSQQMALFGKKNRIRLKADLGMSCWLLVSSVVVISADKMLLT